MFALSIERNPVRSGLPGKPRVATMLNGAPLHSNADDPHRRHVRMLEVLAATPGYVSYAMLARHLGIRVPDPARTLAVYAAGLRRFLKPHGYGIRNVHGLGYMLVRTDEETRAA